MSVTKLKTGKSIEDSILFDDELKKYFSAIGEDRKYITPRDENNSFNVIVKNKYYGALKTFDEAKERRDFIVSKLNFERSLVLSS